MLYEAFELTCAEFLICLGEGDGFGMFAEWGGLFSLEGLDPGNTLAVTPVCFFPEDSSATVSAGRFIPAIPPTARRRQIKEMRKAIQKHEWTQ